MTRERLSLGKEGELFAVDYLKKQGYKIKEQNYKTQLGEIDIIALDGKVLAFIEVKTRKNNAYGFPFEAVNAQKQNQIIKTAKHYLVNRKIKDNPTRFDVLSLTIRQDTYDAELIKHAFEASPF